MASMHISARLQCSRHRHRPPSRRDLWPSGWLPRRVTTALLPSLVTTGNAHLQRFPGTDAAVLRKRIERDVDVRKFGKMFSDVTSLRCIGCGPAKLHAPRSGRSGHRAGSGSSSAACLMTIVDPAIVLSNLDHTASAPSDILSILLNTPNVTCPLRIIGRRRPVQIRQRSSRDHARQIVDSSRRTDAEPLPESRPGRRRSSRSSEDPFRCGCPQAVT